MIQDLRLQLVNWISEHLPHEVVVWVLLRVGYELIGKTSSENIYTFTELSDLYERIYVKKEISQSRGAKSPSK